MFRYFTTAFYLFKYLSSSLPSQLAVHILFVCLEKFKDRGRSDSVFHSKRWTATSCHWMKCFKQFFASKDNNTANNCLLLLLFSGRRSGLTTFFSHAASIRNIQNYTELFPYELTKISSIVTGFICSIFHISQPSTQGPRFKKKKPCILLL